MVPLYAEVVILCELMVWTFRNFLILCLLIDDDRSYECGCIDIFGQALNVDRAEHCCTTRNNISGISNMEPTLSVSYKIKKDGGHQLINMF